MKMTTTVWASLMVLIVMNASAQESVATSNDGSAMRNASDDLAYHSNFLNVELSGTAPAFASLVVDALGKNKRNENPIILKDDAGHMFVGTKSHDVIVYRSIHQQDGGKPLWEVRFSEKTLCISSGYSADNRPFEMFVNQSINHATVLGEIREMNKMSFPCLIHFPGMGTFRVTCDRPGASLLVDARRNEEPHFVKIDFPCATLEQQEITYNLEVVCIYPAAAGIDDDPLYDGFKRNYINMFQLNPQLQVLANNSSSDACAFTVYQYSDMAVHTPPFANGLTALDLLRLTLDKYLAGFKGYGMIGFHMFGNENNSGDQAVVSDFLDTYPSLLIAAYNYVEGTRDTAWLRRNYQTIKSWAEKMAAYDTDDDGLLEYPLSGNSGSWGNTSSVKARPANWWDTIGFGCKDAYSNALAYRAFAGMEQLALTADDSEAAKNFEKRAAKLKSVYYKTFYNPETGVLAGWKSADGKLHDYYFTFVNGVAITCGLIEKDKANSLMDRILAKMKEVGYTDFSLGLPGNLIPVRREDYAHKEKRWGGGEKEDGSDGFQIYENGGATGCFSYFTIKALQMLNRREEADAILIPILRSIDAGNFEGTCSNGMTKDWKTWKGGCWGYEGFLVDNYMVLLAVLK